MAVADNLGIDLIVRGDGLLAFADGDDAARLLDAGTFSDYAPAGPITYRNPGRFMSRTHAADRKPTRCPSMP